MRTGSTRTLGRLSPRSRQGTPVRIHGEEGCISPKHSVTNPDLLHLLGLEALKTSVRPKHDELPAAARQPSEDAVPPTQNELRCAERRGLPRKSVMLQGEVSWAGALKLVRISDLSSEGTSIRTDELPSVGSHVKFSRQGHTVQARVAWIAQGRSGLEFREPTDAATLLRPIAKRQSAPQPRFRRSPLDRRYMSETDKQWNEQPPLSWGAVGLGQLSETFPSQGHQVVQTGHEQNDAHAKRRERIWRLSHEINRRLFSQAEQLQRFD